MKFYIACAVIGGILTLFSLFGHDFGDYDFDHDGEIDVHGDNSPGIFSFRTLVVFLTTFGIVGVICTYYGLSPHFVVLLSMISGAFLGTLTWWIMSLAMKQQVNSVMNLDSIIGKTAIVTTTIPINGVGEIALQFNNQRKHITAKSKSDETIKEHSPVKIIDYSSGVAVVELS